ncbi:hypothetical protein G6F43_002450 [Rhizopus delemar]|nr:hypothetical protein G6F43_002450 [Rhizopus delemar]
MAIDASGFRAIQGKIYTQEDFGNDFEPPLKSAFNYVPFSDPFEGFKKNSDDNNDKNYYTATAFASKGSNNQEKRTSKTGQKKKGKQVALEIAEKKKLSDHLQSQ